MAAPAAAEIARIVDQLEREYDGDPWHGSPMTAILAGIDARRAAAHPVAGGHSIWEIVLHTIGWKNETTRRLQGGVAAMPVEGDWPDIGEPTDERWKDVLQRLDAAQASLIAAVKALPIAKLYEPTNDKRSGPLGTGVSYYVLLHGIVQHDVYHAGQMSLLKKAL